MSKASEKKAEQQQAADYLRTLFPPGSTVVTVLLHTSRSGMLRSIGVLGIEDGEIKDVSWAVARALGWPFDRDRGGVKVSGCGMDMGFHLVHVLSATLYPECGGCVGEGCDHKTGEGSDHWHNKGGYALRRRWI